MAADGRPARREATAAARPARRRIDRAQPRLVQGRRHLPAARQGLPGLERRRHRRLRRADAAARPRRRSSASPRSGCCRSTPRRCATTATTSPTTARSTRPTATMRDFSAFVAEAHRRGLRVITELVINHTSDQHPWFQRARARQARLAGARLLRLERHRPTATARPGSSSSTPRSRTGPGTRWPRPIFWHRFYCAPARPQLRQPARCCEEVLKRLMRLLARHGRRRAAARRHPLSRRARGHQQREPAGDPRVLKAIRAEIDRHYPDRMLLAEANQWPEDTRPYFGDGDECHMALPLPADAADVHGAGAGGPAPDHRHHPPDAGHPRQLPVGDLPAQPRRADARDGDRARSATTSGGPTPRTRAPASISASAAGSRR